MEIGQFGMFWTSGNATVSSYSRSISRYGPHLGPHLGTPEVLSSLPLLICGTSVPPYRPVCPSGIPYMGIPDTPYIETTTDGLLEGLQNPPNTEIPPVSSYSRSCFRPCETMDPPIHRYTILGHMTHLPGITSKRYMVTRNHVQEVPIPQE